MNIDDYIDWKALSIGMIVTLILMAIKEFFD